MRNVLILLLVLFLTIQTSLSAQASGELKAAFLRGNNLWMKIGQRETQITDGGGVNPPEWSHDGKWIAYSKRNGSISDYDIWVYNTGTGTKYRVFHNGHNYKWAPDKDILAFLGNSVLNVTDLSGKETLPFQNVALGIGNYSWLPDGSGFLVSSNAALRPDGWTNPTLYKIKLEAGLKPVDMFKNAQKFFVIPNKLLKNSIEILSISTSSFKWSDDKGWISFIVQPTASWSMDSNMLCVLSSNGKSFESLDEMASGFAFRWAPNQNELGYIQGSGRIVFGFKNKNLKTKMIPFQQSEVITPKNFVDLGFTWFNDANVIVSRSPQMEWSNNPSKRVLPKLDKVNIFSKDEQKITDPPSGFGDFDPEYLPRNNKLTWIRSNWEKHDVWVSDANGFNAEKWIQNIDYRSIRFYQD